MEQKRETKEITTINGHKIVMHTYITGFEKRAISEALFSEASMNPNGNEMIVSGLKGNAVFKSENEALRLIIVSVDGSTEDIVTKVLSLRSEDADDVLKAINEVTEGKKKEIKTV